jgi:hypothetical protein
MIIVPGLPPLQQTRHSRELGRKIEQLVRDYQREHPDVKESDVRAAVSQLASGGESLETIRRKRILGVVMATLMAGAFAAMAASGGGQFENNTAVWRVIGVVVAVVALGLTAVRMARKD